MVEPEGDFFWDGPEHVLVSARARKWIRDNSLPCSISKAVAVTSYWKGRDVIQKTVEWPFDPLYWMCPKNTLRIYPRGSKRKSVVIAGVFLN